MEYSNKILLCDDNAAFIRLIMESLIDNNDALILDYILLANNIDDALKIYMEERPVAVFMDLRFSEDRDGLEGAKIIKEYDSKANIYMLTNYPDDPKIGEALSKNFATGKFDKGVGSGVLATFIGFMFKVFLKAV